MINKTRPGFTLVELSIVMTFISLLLLAILYSTIHISKIYAKGITNRQINQVGRELTDTIRRDFLVADATRINSYILSSGDSGRICLGKVSYVWNSATRLNAGGSDVNTIKEQDDSPVIFSRVEDAGGSLCVKTEGVYPTKLGSAVEETALLSGEGRTLAVYDIIFSSLVPNKGGDGLYSLSMTIGTNDSDAVDVAARQCKPPTDHSSNFEYCAVADFSMIVRAGGESK